LDCVDRVPDGKPGLQVEGNRDAGKLAQGLKAALEQTNSKK